MNSKNTFITHLTTNKQLRHHFMFLPQRFFHVWIFSPLFCFLEKLEKVLFFLFFHVWNHAKKIRIFFLMFQAEWKKICLTFLSKILKKKMYGFIFLSCVKPKETKSGETSSHVWWQVFTDENTKTTCKNHSGRTFFSPGHEHRRENSLDPTQKKILTFLRNNQTYDLFFKLIQWSVNSRWLI